MSQPLLLCVDDRPAVLQVRETMFEDHGYSVVTASDAPTAITILEKRAIAAVILEYTSEGIDAETVAWSIKRKFPHEPVVLLSAYSEVPERVFWLVDEYVMRSEPLDAMLQIIARVIGPAMTAEAVA